MNNSTYSVFRFSEFTAQVIDLGKLENMIYKSLLTSCVILVESTVTSVLILFIKINAFTWPKVWRFVYVWARKRENKRAKVQKK